jgi:hypothetical protein
MGFLAAILIGLVVIAAIGYAIIYAATVFLLAIVCVASMIAYFLLYFLLGDGNGGLAMLLAIPLGIGIAVLFVKDFKGET